MDNLPVPHIPIGSRSFGGSRTLNALGMDWAHEIGWITVSLGIRLNVGCANGADMGIRAGAWRRDPAMTTLFCAASDPTDPVFPPSAALGKAAAQRRVTVVWNPPDMHANSALALRSQNCMAAGTAAGFILASPDSPGSLAAARWAAGHGRPVTVWCVGFPIQSLPKLANIRGLWVEGREDTMYYLPDAPKGIAVAHWEIRKADAEQGELF